MWLVKAKNKTPESGISDAKDKNHKLEKCVTASNIFKEVLFYFSSISGRFFFVVSTDFS